MAHILLIQKNRLFKRDKKKMNLDIETKAQNCLLLDSFYSSRSMGTYFHLSFSKLDVAYRLWMLPICVRELLNFQAVCTFCEKRERKRERAKISIFMFALTFSTLRQIYEISEVCKVVFLHINYLKLQGVFEISLAPTCRSAKRCCLLVSKFQSLCRVKMREVTFTH